MIPFNTPRLQLRWMTPDDAQFIMALLDSPGWKQYINDRNIDTIIKAEAYLQSTIIPSYEKLGFGFYLIERLADHEALGLCGLVKRSGLEDIDIGYALLPQYEGQGYAAEAALATIEYGFNVHSLKRIVAICTQDNLRSIALLKKLGMDHEKMIRLPDDDTELMLFGINQKD